MIAQEPCEKRDASRVMIVERRTGNIGEKIFRDIVEYFSEGDVLVINDSKVLPARLYGRKTTGGALDVLLLRKAAGHDSETWEVLLRPAKRVKIGDVVNFSDVCEGLILQRLTEKKWLIRFSSTTPFSSFLDRYGRAPLPPYIKRSKEEKRQLDRARYQTIYAKNPGSVAAPTAGFHFSEEVLAALRQKSVKIAPVTLHVGHGTFTPITTENIENHVMEEEDYEITAEAAKEINDAKRIVAVGTTSTRTLEAACDSVGRVAAQCSSTELFIYPGFKFNCVDALLTNLHLPKSSLYLLVCAFAGKELIEEAYRKAIEKRFRFYSYGDCMLII